VGEESREESRVDATEDAKKDSKTPPQAAAPEEPIWIVDAGEGQLHLVRGGSGLKELIAARGLARTARVYMLATTSMTLGEIAEVQSAFAREADVGPSQAELDAAPEDGAAAAAEPPVEPATQMGRAEPAGEERDDELALLDRPFDDGEYFEDPPRSRWLRPAGMAALLVVLFGGGYRLFHSRSAPRAQAQAHEHETTPVAAPAPAPTSVATAAVIAAAPPPPAAPERPAGAQAAPGAPDPAGPATVAQEPAAASSARPRYPELVAEGERQFQDGHSKRAEALFSQALAETPEGTAALVGLAYVNLDRGKVSQAIALFKRALAQDRGDPTALFGLAESHRQEGNRSAALAEFQKFLTLRTTGRDADIARQLVADLTNGS
jgi:tetratricopeptide (TPR) repeat protein